MAETGVQQTVSLESVGREDAEADGMKERQGCGEKVSDDDLVRVQRWTCRFKLPM